MPFTSASLSIQSVAELHFNRTQFEAIKGLPSYKCMKFLYTGKQKAKKRSCNLHYNFFSL